MSNNKEATRKWRKDNAARWAKTKNEWRLANLEKVRASHRKWCGLPEPTRPMPALCELCGGPPNGRSKSLYLDHCHVTGKFRGWLCNNCNLGLGRFGDTLDGLRRAVLYLERLEHE